MSDRYTARSRAYVRGIFAATAVFIGIHAAVFATLPGVASGPLWISLAVTAVALLPIAHMLWSTHRFFWATEGIERELFQRATAYAFLLVVGLASASHLLSAFAGVAHPNPLLFFVTGIWSQAALLWALGRRAGVGTA